MKKNRNPIAITFMILTLIASLFLNGTATELIDIVNQFTESAEDQDETKKADETESIPANSIKTDMETAETKTAETVHEHVYSETVKENEVEATCNSKGSYDEVILCSCGHEMDRRTKYVDALEHDYKLLDVVEATCTADGYSTYACSLCGNQMTDDETDAVGHRFKNLVCEVCGFEQFLESDEIMAILNDSMYFNNYGYNYISDKKSVKVFAKDISSCFTLACTQSFNINSGGISVVAFNVSDYDFDELYMNVGGVAEYEGTVKIKDNDDNNTVRVITKRGTVINFCKTVFALYSARVSNFNRKLVSFDYYSEFEVAPRFYNATGSPQLL